MIWVCGAQIRLGLGLGEEMYRELEMGSKDQREDMEMSGQM